MDEFLQSIVDSTPGFMPTEEGLALMDAAKQIAHLGPIVEIGTYCGKSTLYLASGAREHGGTVITIDHHRGSEEHQPGWDYHDPDLVDTRVGLIDTVPTLRLRLHEAGVEDTVVVVIGSSAQVGAVWSTPLSMVFIDGGHTERAAMTDYRVWAHHVMPGGMLAIHDVFPDPADGGQAPFHIFRQALDAGDFVEASVTGSLRILTRIR